MGWGVIANSGTLRGPLASAFWYEDGPGACRSVNATSCMQYGLGFYGTWGFVSDWHGGQDNLVRGGASSRAYLTHYPCSRSCTVFRRSTRLHPRQRAACMLLVPRFLIPP